MPSLWNDSISASIGGAGRPIHAMILPFPAKSAMPKSLSCPPWALAVPRALSSGGASGQEDSGSQVHLRIYLSMYVITYVKFLRKNLWLNNIQTSPTGSPPTSHARPSAPPAVADLYNTGNDVI